MPHPGPNNEIRYTANESAAYHGIKPSTWWSYSSREQVPGPDGYEGDAHPYWLEATVKGYLPGTKRRRWVEDLPPSLDRMMYQLRLTPVSLAGLLAVADRLVTRPAGGVWQRADGEPLSGNMMAGLIRKELAVARPQRGRAQPELAVLTKAGRVVVAQYGKEQAAAYHREVPDG